MEQKKQREKTFRALEIYDKLLRGECIYKKYEAQKFGVTEKSIQRDIETIREYLGERRADEAIESDIVYDRKRGGYYLEQFWEKQMSNAEILSIAKIMLDCRPFTKDEMMNLLDKLVECCVPVENRKIVNLLIANEKFHYIEPQHGKVYMDKLWEIGKAIHESKYVEFTYLKLKEGEQVKRKVQPQAILFSEYYFYLVANIDNIDKQKEFQVADDAFPTIYRIDRILELEVLNEHFKIPYKDRFEEGEYRKRIQFMYGGKLQKTVFWYKGLSVEAVLDRLPTAKVLKEETGRFLISAETFGTGIDMWLRSQGDAVEVVKK